MTHTEYDRKTNICFIGAGNMATSLVGGLIANDYPSDQLFACDIDPVKLKQVRDKYQISTGTDVCRTIKSAEVVILAVKPQVIQAVCKSIAGNENQPLYISIAAGVREADINRWLGGNQAVVRCMPNTPALVGLGASALFANPTVDKQQKELAEKILSTTGITVWVNNESELDAVTAISGSGPAYFFLFIEALQIAAQELGLSVDTASLLAKQTALGAATMAIDKDVSELRQQVTSKGGTTERAIQSFSENNLFKLVFNAAQAAEKRSIELAEELAADLPKSQLS